MRKQSQKRAKLTPALIEQIVSDRRRGASYADIAARHNVSVGSVRNALTRAAAARSAHGPERDSERSLSLDGDTPPSPEELRRWLAQQVRDLRADAERAREEDDRPALERLSRQLVAASALLARVTPPDVPETPDVTSKRMAEAAARVRKTMRQWLEVLTSDDPGMVRARETLTRDPRAVAQEELGLLMAKLAREERKPSKAEQALIDLLGQILAAPEHILPTPQPRHPFMDEVIERLRATEEPS